MDAEEHKRYHRKILYVVIIILVMLFGGTTFYHYTEGWRYIDALYFSSATMTTVGYGDITPQTDKGKIFTVFYVFTAVSIALYGLTLFSTHFIEVREEFWVSQFVKIKGGIKTYRPKNTFDRIKSFFSYNPAELVREEVYPPVDIDQPHRRKRQKK